MFHPASMTTAEVAAVVEELEAVATGARIREIRQRGDSDLILTLRVPGRNLFLLLSAHPRTSRIYGLPTRPGGVWKTSAFRDACRHDLTGGRVDSIAACPGDRRVILTVVRGGQAEPGPDRFTLHAELYGRFSNLILVDGTGTIREVLIPVKGKRNLHAREPYEALPPVPGSREAPLPGWARPPSGSGDLAINAAAAHHYEAAVVGADLEEARQRVLKRVRASQTRGRRKMAHLQAELEKAGRAEKVRQQGELLKGSLHLLKRGMEEIEVVDYFMDPPERLMIPLDPTKPPQANLEAVFKRYRKLRSSREKTRRVLEAVHGQQEELDGFRIKVQAASSLMDLERLEADAVRRHFLSRRQPPPRQRDPREDTSPRKAILTFQSRDGLPILVGRTGAENDRITFQIARGHDLWLHIRDYPGSHVVVRIPKGKSCPPETLLDAAHLAVHFSKIRGARKASVTHTPRKHVSKMKKAPPGKVTLSRSSVLDIRIEADRMARLLGTLA